MKEIRVLLNENATKWHSQKVKRPETLTPDGKQKRFTFHFSFCSPLIMSSSSYSPSFPVLTEGCFAVGIVVKGQKVPIAANGYVALAHETEYAIYLENNCCARTEVNLFVDGKESGTWILSPYQKIKNPIERPENEAKKFTFLRDTTKEAQDAGIKAGESKNGVVHVVFKPEKKDELDHVRSFALCASSSYDKCYSAPPLPGATLHAGAMRSMSLSYQTRSSERREVLGDFTLSDAVAKPKYSSGATGLGAHSDQIFGTTHLIKEYNEAGHREIKLRLVYKEDDQAWKYTPLVRVQRAITPPPVCDESNHDCCGC